MGLQDGGAGWGCRMGLQDEGAGGRCRMGVQDGVQDGSAGWGCRVGCRMGGGQERIQEFEFEFFKYLEGLRDVVSKNVKAKVVYT